MSEHDHDHYLNTTTLAERWDSTPGRLANWRSEGRGPAWLKVGARVLYPLSAVRAWERENMVIPADAA